MLYPSINKIRKKADSRYTLVILAAKRARDLIDGKPALTEDSVARPVSIAAHEIAEDLITYKKEGAPRKEWTPDEEDGITELESAEAEAFEEAETAEEDAEEEAPAESEEEPAEEDGITEVEPADEN